MISFVLTILLLVALNDLIRRAILGYKKFQEQLACPENKYSTLFHEYIHWSDAYRNKYSDFANADNYKDEIKSWFE